MRPTLDENAESVSALQDFPIIIQTFGFLTFLTRYQENTNIQFFLLKGRERAEDLREQS